MTQYNKNPEGRYLKDLIILGPQGSGKGTQVHLLEEKLGFALIESGSSLREIAKTDTDLGKKIKERIDQGMLVEPEMVTEVIKEKISKIPYEQGLIIEGYPRNISQYEHMKKFYLGSGRKDYQVLFIEIPKEESIKRLSSRRVCEDCGKNYIVGTVDECSHCGGNLVQRHDDYPEAVENRLAWSNSELMPLVNLLKEEGKLIIIDGRPSVEEVFQNIIEKLNLSQ